MRFVEDIKLALRRRNKDEVKTLCEEIEAAEENDYELSEEEEILFDRLMTVLERL